MLPSRPTRSPLRSGPITVVADTVPAMIWISDMDGWRTFFNKAWLDFTGRTMADEAGHGWTANIHPDDCTPFLEAYHTACRTAHGYEREYRLRRADGDFRWILETSAPRVGDDGTVEGFVGCCLDITLRKTALAALAASDERFRALADNASDVIYRRRLDGPPVVEYISPSVLALSGYGPEDFYANSNLIHERVHPDDRHLLTRTLPLDPNNLNETVIVRWFHRDGSIVFVEHRRSLVVDAQGRITAVQGIARDVTERVEAERRLGESEARFRLLAEHANDMIYRFRMLPTPASEYVSPASLKVTGYPPERFYADPMFPIQALHPDDRATAMRMMTNPREFTAPIVLRWIHPDGTIHAAAHSIVPEYDDDGVLIAIQGVGHDVTHRLAVEGRLRASEAQLRRLAAGLQAAREVERTHIARELHDELGQTLTAIKMELTRTFNEWLSVKSTPALVDHVQSMVGSIDLATESVPQLATSLRPPALDHLGLVAALESEAAGIERRTSLRCRVISASETVALDRERSTAVFRIVQEALTNAIRHADASAVTIFIHQKKERLAVIVRDNGRGIPADVIAAPRSIGLLGMRERAEMAGARLTISSKPGKGTSIALILGRGVA